MPLVIVIGAAFQYPLEPPENEPLDIARGIEMQQ